MKNKKSTKQASTKKVSAEKLSETKAGMAIMRLILPSGRLFEIENDYPLAFEIVWNSKSLEPVAGKAVFLKHTGFGEANPEHAKFKPITIKLLERLLDKRKKREKQKTTCDECNETIPTSGAVLAVHRVVGDGVDTEGGPLETYCRACAAGKIYQLRGIISDLYNGAHQRVVADEDIPF